MLAPMKAILEDANRNHYAVMAINTVNMEMARAAIEAAEEEHSAVILQFGKGQMQTLAHKEEMLPMIKEMADKAHVPVCINLDHGSDFTLIVDCINAGFTNVMFDGSSLPYEENVRQTAIIAALAHGVGCSVEGELGHVGQADAAEDSNEDLYTKPELAVDFVERTGIDALAVAVGTAHGAYPKGKIPKLDFERLHQLKAATKMPLVLHGGSGAGDENIIKAVAGGINKINVCTDAFEVGKEALLKAAQEGKNYMQMCAAAEKAVKEFAKDYMRLIGSSGRFTFETVDNDSRE